MPLFKKQHDTEHFKLSEFACKCGCSYNIIDQIVVDYCEAIRQQLKAPIMVTSGCRCKYWNNKVGGVSNSYHIHGFAADLSCSEGADKIFEIVKKLYEARRLPALGYCRYYQGRNFVHVDIGRQRSRIFVLDR